MKRTLPHAILATSGVAGTIGSGVVLGEISNTLESDSSRSLRGESQQLSSTQGVEDSESKVSQETTTRGGAGSGGASASAIPTQSTKSKDPLKDGIPNPNKKRNSSDYTSEVWECTKKMFPGLESQIKHDRTRESYFDYPSWLNWKKDWELNLMSGDSRRYLTQKEKTIGCGIAQIQPLGNSPNNHWQDFYLKTEIVVKNDRTGFILWVDWATDKGQNDSNFIYRMLLVHNEDSHPWTGQERWKLRGGLWWYDNNDFYPFMSEWKYYIKFPGNEKPWFEARDKNSSVSETKSWFGIWTTNDDNSTPKKQIFADIYISSTHDNKSELLGGNDITPFERCKAYKWCGWYYSHYYYENREGRDKGWWGFWRRQDLSKELQQWYQPFKTLRGVWKNSNEVCDGANNSTTYVPLKKLCLDSDKSEVK